MRGPAVSLGDLELETAVKRCAKVRWEIPYIFAVFALVLGLSVRVSSSKMSPSCEKNLLHLQLDLTGLSCSAVLSAEYRVAGFFQKALGYLK